MLDLFTQVMPYPEDVVRCHAVIQAWNIEVCHCVYANKTYTIEKDDKQWAKDMAECRKFLDSEILKKSPPQSYWYEKLHKEFQTLEQWWVRSVTSKKIQG